MVKDMKKHALLVIIALLFRIGQAAYEYDMPAVAMVLWATHRL